MSKRFLMSFIGAAALGLTATAQAGTLHFVYTEAGGINFSFDQSSAPTPISGVGFSTQVPISDFGGDIGPYASIVWWTAPLGSGMFETPDGAYSVTGPQVFTGTVADPRFAPGVFSGTDQTDGLGGTLTITAVPEPAAWALMLAGFGALGATLRSRKQATARA